MKNRFTTVYLYLFIADSSLLVLHSLLKVIGVQLFEVTPFNWFAMGINLIIIPLAIVQVIIAYRQKLRRSAKIIGLYPLIFILVALFIATGLIVSNISQLADKNMTNVMKGMTNFSLLASIVQLGIGIWAMKDISGGHYLTEIKPIISTKKIVLKCSIALLVAVVFVIAIVIIMFQNVTSELFKVPSDLIKYYRSSEYLNKSVFIEDQRIGRITDIAFGKLDSNPQLIIGVAGNNGALLFNKTLAQKIFIPFSESSECTAIVKTGNECIFLSPKGYFKHSDPA